MASTGKKARSSKVFVVLVLGVALLGNVSAQSENLYYNMSNGFQDLSGNSYDGTGFNGITSGDVLGIYGDATSFDGDDEYVDVPSITALSDDDGSFSISFWAKSSDWSGLGWIFDGQETHAITVNTESSNNIAFAVAEKGGSNNFAKYSGLQDNTWYHFVAVKSTNNGMELYVNDSLEATNSGATFTDYNDVSWENNIGRDSSNSDYYFEGTVDDFKIFDEALTSSQVNNLYTFTQPNTEPSLSNPSPADGETNVSTNTSLSIDYTDSDGDSGRVEFYNASDNSLIENVTGVSSGSKAVTSDLPLDQEATVEWYAKAFDGNNGFSETSNFSFTTISEQVSGSFGSNCFAGWRFNETSGPALDYCGSNNGDWNGGISSIEGVSSNYAFDGLAYDFSNDGYVDIPDDMAFADGSSSFTLSAWVYPTDINEFGWIFDFQSDYSIALNSENTDNLVFTTKFESGNCQIKDSGYSNDQWYHVVAVYDSSNGCELIVNNTSKVTGSNTGSFFTGGSNNWIGGDSSSPSDSSRYFDGRIDDPKIFDEALNSSEISNLYQYGTTDISNTDLFSADLPNGSLNLPVDGATVDPSNSYNGTFTWYGDPSKVELWMNDSSKYRFSLSNFQNRTLASETDQWFGRASVAEADNGNWYMVYREASGHTTESSDVLHLKCSSDEGNTWSAEDTRCDGTSFSLFPFDSGQPDQDPDIFTAPNGTIQINMHRQNNKPIYLMSNDNGRSWSNEGTVSFSSTGGYSESDIQLGQDHVVVGDTVWITAWIFEPSHKSVLFKSEDNGYSYDFVTTVSGETTDESDEIGIEYLGESDFLTVIRDRSRDKTYQRVVYDNGSSLGSFEDITGKLNGDIVQRPRLVKFSDGSIRMAGRDFRTLSNESIGVWTTVNGSQWREYNLNDFGDIDSGYGDLMERDNYVRDTYYATYLGNFQEADIIDYRFEMNPLEDWMSVDEKTTGLSNNSLFNFDINASELDLDLDSSHEWNFKGYDKLGESSFAASNRSVFIESNDAGTPLIDIYSPQNQIYGSSSVDLNVASSEPATFNYNVDGSGNISVSDTGTDLNETISGLSDGGHTVNVYATDSAGNTGSASTSFTVNTNSAPAAAVSKNVTNPKTLEVIEFDASGSDDTDGSISSYTWDLNNDGSFGDATGLTAQKSYSDNTPSGTVEDVSVKVTDNDGLTDTNSIKFSVDNRQPSASFTTSTSNLTVDVDASGSSDSDGSISSYEYDWTNDGIFDATGQTASKTYNFAGSYNVKLRVTDDDGATSTSLSTVDVSDGTTGGGGGGDTDSGPTKVAFTLDNVGSSAWGVENDSTNVADDSENPDINLEQGKRYTIRNNGYGTYGTHPLAFFDADGNTLLSQSGTGSFEDDSDVNWVDNGDTISFTVTQELYNKLSGYRCTVHGAMEGKIVQESSGGTGGGAGGTGGGGGGSSTSDDDSTLSATNSGDQTNSTGLFGDAVAENLPVGGNAGIGLLVILALLALPAYKLIQ